MRSVLQRSRHGSRNTLDSLRDHSISRFSSSSAFSLPRRPTRTPSNNLQSLRVDSATISTTSGPEPSAEQNEKPRKRSAKTLSKPSEKNEDASEPLPNALVGPDIHETLWLPSTEPKSSSGSPADDPDPSEDPALPPSWLLTEAYENLLLTLHPHTQHRATYASSNAPPVEPTLALYCPIEGGDYIVDATVRNIAQRADADVIVIDALHLAAGEHGKFGKATSAIPFPNNPLRTQSVLSTPLRSAAEENEDDDDDDDSSHGSMVLEGPSAFTIQIPSSSQSSFSLPSFFAERAKGSVLSPVSRSSSSSGMHKAKSFFDDLLNLNSTPPSSTGGASTKESPRPRIVYIRDFSFIAASSSAWYPALLAAVRARRQGPLSRPTSPVANPTTIIFGVTPTPPTPESRPRQNSILSLIAAARAGRPSSHPRPNTTEDTPAEIWAEKDAQARERRLKSRLRKWAKGRGHEWVREELPKFLSSTSHSSPRSGRAGGENVGFLLSSGVMALPGRSPSSTNSPDMRANGDGYSRVVSLLPSTRSLAHERDSRVTRRREINALAFRMALGEVGGALHESPLLADLDTASSNSEDSELPVIESSSENSQISSPPSLWEEWGTRIQDWDTLTALANAVVGRALALHDSESSPSSLSSTHISWSHVNAAYGNERIAWAQSKRDWVEKMVEAGKQAGIDTSADGLAGSRDEGGKALGPEVDEVLEAVKRDQDLDQHEQRLLGCIVDPATMPTTFASVHLPPATIDSIRTMVSLPLLYPDAFSSGILKTHAMTGALLFGPPGTGKTLLARAIARESGARMMLIKPSDVMDMYVGEGEKLVRSVFTLARRLSPCVVFLDEIDALFGARVSSRDSGGAMAHRGVITEFMQEMDGLKSTRDGNIIVIGATNRPFDLDDAVLRRLPRRLLVDLPGPKEREEIMKILLRDEILAPDVDLTALGKRTEAFSGSDLKHLCISAALDAVKETVHIPWAFSPISTVTGTIDPTPSIDGANIPTTTSPADAASTPETAPIKQAAQVEAVLKQTETVPDVISPSTTPMRIISSRHFTKALKEITPSASESLGSLSSLRKWNDEFGEGASTGKGRKRKAWGDKFGFGEDLKKRGDGELNLGSIGSEVVSP